MSILLTVNLINIILYKQNNYYLAIFQWRLVYPRPYLCVKLHTTFPILLAKMNMSLFTFTNPPQLTSSTLF